MGRTRTPPPETAQRRLSEEEATAAIAAILAGEIATTNLAATIAAVLLSSTLLPAFLLREGAPGAVLAASVASLVVEDPPTPSGGSGALRAAYAEELLYRGRYAIAATKRLVRAVRGPGAPIEERLTKALRAERSYLAAHKNASRRRRATAGMVDAVAAVYGPVLSWRAVLDRATTPECRGAHGKNFSVYHRPAIGWPGSLHGGTCRCVAGPPIPGAPELLA